MKKNIIIGRIENIISTPINVMQQKKSTNPDKIAHQLIYRRLAVARNQRSALSIIKNESKNTFYPAIARSVKSHPKLLSTLVVSDFPTFNNVKKIPNIILRKGSLEDELIWVASVLSLYQEKLNLFAKLKNEYFEILYNEDVGAALLKLEEIEDNFGYSLWLIRSKIYCIFLKDGQKKQQEFVEDLVENNKYQNDMELQFIINYSNAIEEGKEYDEYKETILQIYRNANIESSRLTQNLYRLAPDEITKLSDYEQIISQEEIRVIVDRYETFLFSLYSAIAKNIINENIVFRLEKILNIENEILLKNCYSYFKPFGGFKDLDFFSYNEYTKGNYGWFLSNSISNINLTASALANIDAELDNSKLKNKIINAIKNVLNNINQKKEISFLKKHIALNFGNLYCYQILLILNLFEKEEGENFENIIFLHSNPKTYLRILNKNNIEIDPDILKENLSLSLLQTVNKNDENLLDNIKIAIPETRYNNYLGLIKLNKSDFLEATSFFEKNENNKNPYIQRQAKVNLYNTYLKIDNNYKILDFFYEEIEKNELIDNRMDALDFFRKNYGNNDLLQNIKFSILVDYLKKHKLIDPIFDINLADLLDYVLMGYSIESPIELFDIFGNDIPGSVIYYLRNICTINVIDSLLIYENLDDVEQLRIQICQKLVEIDSTNSKIYRSEIAQITKNIEVNKLFKVVETGRIFVDTDGLKSILSEEVERWLAKCKEVLKAPDYETSPKLKEILNGIYIEQYPQLKNVYLPKNELEEFYFNIVKKVINEFYFNPAYGLDTHVSTAIRHGWLEGYFTKPFMENDLHFELNEGEYVVNIHWQEVLNRLDAKFMKELRRDLISLNRKLSEIIKTYLNKKLQFDALAEEEKNSLFNIFWSKEQHTEVALFIQEDTLTEELFEKIFLVCLGNLESDLVTIRQDIDNTSVLIVGLLDRIIHKIEKSSDRNLLSNELNKIVQTRESFHQKMQTVKSWFYISTDFGVESFQIANAVSVSIKQIENCFGFGKPTIDIKDNFESLNGKYFEGLCKILFLLLQNAIIHNEFTLEDVLKLDLNIDDNSLCIKSSNFIDTNNDLDVFRKTIAEAQMNLTVNRARLEGGSGLSKIKVIAEFDFKKEFDIHLNVSNDYLFTVIILIKDINDIYS